MLHFCSMLGLATLPQTHNHRVRNDKLLTLQLFTKSVSITNINSTMVIKENNDGEIEYNGFEVSKARKRQHNKRTPKNANHRNSCQEHTCINNNKPGTSSNSSSSNSQLLQRFNESIPTRELHNNSDSEPGTYAPHHSSVPFDQQMLVAQTSTPTSNQSRKLPKKRKMRVRRDRQCSKRSCANCEMSKKRLQYNERKVESIRRSNELLRRNILLLNRRSEQLYNILVATGLTEQ